jgi:hypothetical protein
VICVGDNSRVVLQDGTLRNWSSKQGTVLYAVKVSSRSTSLVISNTTFLRDEQEGDVEDHPGGGALWATAGQASIVSSSFVGCHASQGGAIAVSGQAQVDIGSSPTGEVPVSGCVSLRQLHRLCHWLRQLRSFLCSFEGIMVFRLLSAAQISAHKHVQALPV